MTASSPCPDSKLRVVYICIETCLLCDKWTVSASYPCPDSRLLYCTFGNCHLRDKWTVTASFPCPVHPVQLETVISAIKGGCQPPTPALNIWKPVPSATEHASTYLLHIFTAFMYVNTAYIPYMMS